jgi:hypothetical protein
MNMRLIFPVLVALALVPMLATHRDFGPSLGVGSGYTSDWHASTQDASGEPIGSFECISAGADLLRRAAPPIHGAARSSWAHRPIGLMPGERPACVYP